MATTLNWHHLVPLFLPPYSPDLNPIETIWRVLKERSFTAWIAHSQEELIHRTCCGINTLVSNPSEITSITNFHYLRR